MKKIICLTIIFCLVLSMNNFTLAETSTTNISSTTVKELIENDLDDDNFDIPEIDQWILLEDMTGSEYAYFIPIEENEVIIGYSVVSFLGKNLRTLMTTTGSMASDLACAVLQNACDADNLIYNFPNAFILEGDGDSYFKICTDGNLEEISDISVYQESSQNTTNFLESTTSSAISLQSTTYGALSDWKSGDFVPVTSGSKTYYGGRQSWLTSEGVSTYYANRSCGVTAAANLLYYTATHDSDKEDLYDQSGITKSKFSDFQKEVYDVLDPSVIGIPTLKKMISGVEEFASDQGVDLDAYTDSSSWTEAHVRSYISKGLKGDHPVLLLTWNSPIDDLEYHWVTVTRLYKSSSTTKMVVSTWGEKATYDFSTWVNSATTAYQAVIYFK